MGSNFSSELDETAINLSLKCKISVGAFGWMHCLGDGGESRAGDPESLVVPSGYAWGLS